MCPPPFLCSGKCSATFMLEKEEGAAKKGKKGKA